MGKPVIVSFANQKGGVGKTTSCVNIASSLAARGHRVLLVDGDPQGNATSGVGIQKKSIVRTVYDALLDDEAGADCVLPTAFENLFLVPSTLNLAGAELELFDFSDRERRLRSFIARVSEAEAFDFVFIDCPPSLSMLTINALTASDGVVIPMQCEFFALEGLAQLMLTIRKVKQAYNPSLTVLGILITMYNGRLNLSSQVLGEIKKYYADKLFQTNIPRSVKLSEAPGYGEPINHHDRFSKASVAYDAVAKELLDRVGLV